MILSDSHIPWTASSCCCPHFSRHIAVSVRPPPLPGPEAGVVQPGRESEVLPVGWHLPPGAGLGPSRVHPTRLLLLSFPFYNHQFSSFPFSFLPFPCQFLCFSPKCNHTVNPSGNSWMTIPASKLKVTWCPFCCVQSGHQDLSSWTDLSGLHRPSSPGNHRSGDHCGAACPRRRGWKVGASLTVTGEGQQAWTVQCVSVPWVMTRGAWN